MENKNISLLILGFVMLIIGVVLLPTIAELGNDKTNKIEVNDEAIDISAAVLAGGEINGTYPFTVTNAPTGWETTECPLTSITYGNSSTDFTVTTDYTITASTGVLYLVNTTAYGYGATNDTVIDYTHCDEDYIVASWQRTILDLVPGFMAIALLIISVGIFFQIAKEEGIIDSI